MTKTLADLRTRALPLLAAAVAWACSACASSHRTSYAAPSVATTAPAPRLAILPIDIDVRVDGMEELEPGELEAIRAEVVSEVRRLVATELPKRGYDLAAALDWSGNDLVDPAAIEDMVDGLVAHANAVAWKNPPGGNIDPELTRYLGDNTGADTLLYVNGSALANTSAKKVWQTVLVLGVVLAIVGTVIAVGQSSSGNRRGGGARVSGRSSGGTHVHRSSYRHHHHGPVLAGPVIFVSHRSHGTSAAPAPEVEEPGFFDGERVRMIATLVDAWTGEILWHADEQQRVDPRDAGDLADYVGDLLEGLPRGSPARLEPVAEREKRR